MPKLHSDDYFFCTALYWLKELLHQRWIIFHAGVSSDDLKIVKDRLINNYKST
jgi:hypothetical protein